MTRLRLRLAAATAIALVASKGFAVREGKTATGEPYMTGGVSEDVRDEMLRQRDKYNLFVSTASKSGEYLADAHVTITDQPGKQILATTVDGPWLYVNLKLGVYKVKVRYDGQTQEQQTTIHKGDHHEMVFRFDERTREPNQ